MNMNRRKSLEDSSKVLSASLIAGGTAVAETAVQVSKTDRKYQLIGTKRLLQFPDMLMSSAGLP